MSEMPNESFFDMPEDPDDRTSDGFVAWLDALAQTADDDELFAVLASQRPPTSGLARQQIRGRLIKVLKERFTELAIDGSPAKIADAWLKEGGDDGELLQGSEWTPEKVIPWETAVTGRLVLDEVKDMLSNYVHVSEDGLVALTLWTAFTHVYDCFGVAPILDISSPTMRCGKSSTVVIVRHLCHAGMLSGNITPSAVFRAVDAWKPTLLIDEADTFAAMNDELRGIINSGHTRDTAFVVRSVGDTNEPRVFSTWAPKLVAAIGRLPQTIEDRSIRIVMTRKPVGVEKRDAFDVERPRQDCGAIRRRLVRFALDSLNTISSVTVRRPSGLNDRAWNNWKPLFAVAEAVGGDWPSRAERAALALSGDVEDIDLHDVGTLAVQHVWQVLEPVGRLSTADILEHLISKDEGPWAKWWESSVARGELKSPAARLAKILKPFGIKPRQLKIEGEKTRGYDLEDFASDAVAVYLHKDGTDGTQGTSGPSSDAGCTVRNARTVFSGPLLGDELYPLLLADAARDGHLTETEADQQHQVHKLVLEAAA
jgi:hypothetical protein